MNLHQRLSVACRSLNAGAVIAEVRQGFDPNEAFVYYGRISWSPYVRSAPSECTSLLTCMLWYIVHDADGVVNFTLALLRSLQFDPHYLTSVLGMILTHSGPKLDRPQIIIATHLIARNASFSHIRYTPRNSRENAAYCKLVVYVAHRNTTKRVIRQLLGMARFSHTRLQSRHLLRLIAQMIVLP